ncbi:MAG: S-adenosylmethionine tRNA ribosyltransferase [Marivirga sp.]|nr:S-adenosylmethionine tRNA ribosyltransferase [Marivirga sp.]
MHLNIDDYTYDLPPERIASYPLDKRDESKLLVYDNGQIVHERFKSIASHLPDDTLLFFNDTKVIPARLHFSKETGAVIEIFLLHPVSPSPLLMEAMQTEETCSWLCTIGNVKRWKEGTSLTKRIYDGNLEATLQNKDEGLVRFKWDTGHTFAEIVNFAGETPLPPYLNRKAENSDRERYQTIYSHYEGAVAAPTAGLHFTPEVFQALEQKKIMIDFLTLHVSAGTFQPVKVKDATEHPMHNEQIVVNRKNIENLLLNKFIIPVGTTSMRTLESLYWYGTKLLKDPEAAFTISQNDPYVVTGTLPPREEALHAVLDLMDKKRNDIITGETSIYILPGYTFRVCQGLITNFHQPGSTLILLVAAFIGNDWKKVYDNALMNQYRFLSYGDSSLLLPASK